MYKLLIGLLLSVGISMTASMTTAHAAVANWQKGISIQSRFQEDFGSASFRQSVDNAAKNGVNYVTLVIPVHQDTIRSSYVYIGNDTPSDTALKSGLNYLKSKGMSSAIAIHNNPYDYQWRAFIDATDKNAWFASYGSLLNHYAELGQSAGMSRMIIGTEMSSMTVPANTDRWIRMIQDIRARFSGSLSYSSQRSGYMSDAQSLGFWPQLDKIGISAYYGLGNDGSVQSLQQNWDQWNQQEISVLSAKYNKPVIFTEVGYVSRDGATSDPGTGYMLGTSVNPTLQANAYQALFQYWNDKPNLEGVFFWDWSSDPTAGGTNDGGYTPQNKPAEAVMKQWFGASTPPPTAPAKFTVSATATTSKVATPASVIVSVASPTTLANALVDIEMYNAQNQKISQQFYEQQTLSTSAQNYTLNWTPAAEGTYTVKVGVFTANWQRTLYWNDAVQTVSVEKPPVQTTPPPVTPAPVPQPTPTPPAPTPLPTPVPTPTPSLPTAITIWWPGESVSGLQPYKAIIDGRDVSTYDIYWQADGGTLNKLAENNDPIAHKESMVDMTNWRWNSSNRYVVNFVAKDKTGRTLSEKSVTLKLSY